MTRDLIARAAAAQAAADAERVPACKWCRDTHDLHDLPAGEFECGDPAACHERVREVVSPDRRGLPTPRMSAGISARETGRTAPHAPESACACGFPGRTDTLCHTHRVWLAHLNPEGT